MLFKLIKENYLLRRRLLYHSPYKFNDLFNVIDEGIDLEKTEEDTHHFDLLNMYDVNREKTYIRMEDKSLWGCRTIMKLDVKELADGSLFEVNLRISNFTMFLLLLIWILALVNGIPRLELGSFGNIMLIVNIFFAPYFYTLFLFISESLSYRKFLRTVLKSKLVID